MLCSDLVTVQWPDAAGVDRKEFGVLENVAPGGASLLWECPCPRECGAHFRTAGQLYGHRAALLLRDQRLPGGLEFDDSSRWSHETYAPNTAGSLFAGRPLIAGEAGDARFTSSSHQFSSSIREYSPERTPETRQREVRETHLTSER